MQYASIISSLPMLRFGERPQVTLDEFHGSCSLLSVEDLEELDRVLAGDPGEEGEERSAFRAAWGNADSQIRCSVARSRVDARGASGGGGTSSEHTYSDHSVFAQKAVEDAMSARDPLEGERLLDECRWAIAEELAFADPFGLSGVLAYAVQLQLAWRWSELDEEKAKEVVESFIVESLKREGSMAKYLG